MCSFYSLVGNDHPFGVEGYKEENYLYASPLISVIASRISSIVSSDNLREVFYLFINVESIQCEVLGKCFS